MAVRPSGDMVGDKGAALAGWTRLARGRVLRRLELEFGVELRAEQDDVERHVEPEQQYHHGAERSVDPVVIGEVRHVEGKAGRSDQPRNRREHGTHADPMPFRGPAARTVTVEKRQEEEDKERKERPASDTDGELESV